MKQYKVEIYGTTLTEYDVMYLTDSYSEAFFKYYSDKEWKSRYEKKHHKVIE